MARPGRDVSNHGEAVIELLRGRRAVGDLSAAAHTEHQRLWRHAAHTPLPRSLLRQVPELRQLLVVYMPV